MISGLTKNYRLINLLNRGRGPAFNFLFGGAFSLLILMASLRVGVARPVMRFFLANDYKNAARMSVWILRRRFLFLDVIKDPFYDFVSELKPKEISAFRSYVEATPKASLKKECTSDLLYLAAADIHASIKGQLNHEVVMRLVDDFYNLGDRVLSTTLPSPTSSVEKATERSSDFSIFDAECALRDLNSIVPFLGHKLYLISGTFLGHHRENGFLSHDYDIDLGINIEDFKESDFLEKIKQSDFFVLRKYDFHVEVGCQEGAFTYRSYPALLKLVHQNGLNIDIFIHHLEGNNRWHGSIIHKWSNSEFNLKEDQFSGIDVYVPDAADRYLTENYGDWRTPVKDFDCTTGTPNLVISKNFFSIALFLKKLLYLSMNDELAYSRLKLVLEASGLIADCEGSSCLNRKFL